MKTVLLLSADAHLADRIAGTLARGERVLRLTPFPAAFASPGAWHEVIVVLDCRSLSRTEIERTVIQVRASNREAFRCVALAGAAATRPMDVIGRGCNRDFDIVLSEHDDVAFTLRAILNDADAFVGAAIALEALREHLAAVAKRIAQEVLASDCRVSSVGQVEAALDTDRSALGEQLYDEGSPVPKTIIRVARATYAVVLLRRTNLSLGKIAERIRYSASRWVQELLESEFGARAEELKARTPDMAIEDFLDELLVDWKVGVAGSGGGEGGDPGNLIGAPHGQTGRNQATTVAGVVRLHHD